MFHITIIVFFPDIAKPCQDFFKYKKKMGARCCPHSHLFSYALIFASAARWICRALSSEMPSTIPIAL